MLRNRSSVYGAVMHICSFHEFIVFLHVARENEDFENFVVNTLDEMLSKAYSLEKSLKDQKESLRSRVLMLSQSLAGLMAEEEDTG